MGAGAWRKSGVIGAEDFLYGSKSESVQQMRMVFPLVQSWIWFGVFSGSGSTQLLLPENPAHPVEAPGIDDIGVACFGQVFFCRAGARAAMAIDDDGR